MYSKRFAFKPLKHFFCSKYVYLFVNTEPKVYKQNVVSSGTNSTTLKHSDDDDDESEYHVINLVIQTILCLCITKM